MNNTQVPTFIKIKNYQIKESYYRNDMVKVLLIVLILLGIVTSLTSFLPFSSFLNRLLVAFYITILLFLIFQKIDIFYIGVLTFLFVIIIVDFFLTERSLINFNDLFYLPLWCLNLLMATLYYQELRHLVFKQHRLFLTFSIIWNLIAVLSLLKSNSVINLNGVKSFVGLAGSPHRFAGTAFLSIVSSYIEYTVSKKRIVLLLNVVPLISIFYCGARTYLVIAIVFLLFFIIKMINSIQIRWLVLLVGTIAAVLTVYYLTLQRMNSDAYLWQISHFDMLHFITSGRSDFWIIDLEHFFTSPIFNLIFGQGYNYVYLINNDYYGTAIWAHNDYINVLLAHGFIGLFIFLLVFFVFLKKQLKLVDYKPLYLIMFGFIVFFNAFFNMVYTYTIACLMTPIISIIMLDS